MSEIFKFTKIFKYLKAVDTLKAFNMQRVIKIHKLGKSFQSLIDTHGNTVNIYNYIITLYKLYIQEYALCRGNF